ncbi:ABC-3 protein [Ignisphaera aggregans DSM 17230]|uniref:ABC-3 protein n=1 Tax=Ignisphaera aggregans (strain DSM 17230 / JCM 13409 / AQ1.S1) TaxID=583356 RepID=E0SRF0_IGNAA|nr:ABC-3 protein [Ignisphaera aggregans DSM 17230]
MGENVNNRYILLLLFSILLILTIYMVFTTPIVWLLIFILSATIYGVLSPLIAARRFYFLATEGPHTALFAIAISIVLSRSIGIFNEFIWSIIISMILIYIVGYAIEKGVDPDIATSAMVALSSSGSVIALYHVLTRYSVSYNLWSIILGDPLLSTWNDVYLLGAVCIIAMLIAIATYSVNVYMGIDREYVKIGLSRPWIYSYALYTIVAIASVALLKIVGFVLEHVLILLPAQIAMTISESSYMVLIISIFIALLSSLLGLKISIDMNLAPSGAIGIIVLFIYLLVYILKRLKVFG